MRNHLKVSVISGATGLDALRLEWNQLLTASPTNTFFLTWEWITTWWHVYGRPSRLHVLTARNDKGRLVGIAPLMRSTRRLFGLRMFEVIEFIGTGGDVTPEYLDFIVHPEWERGVGEAFVEHLAADCARRVLDLRPLAATSRHLRALRERLGGAKGFLRCAPDSLCPVLALPPSEEAFIKSRSRNYRKKIGEYERRCDRVLRARVRMSGTPEELRADLEVLADLHRRRWQNRSRAFRSRQYVEFHQRLGALLLNRGWMRLFVLENERPLAALYCFAYAGRYYYYQAGRDPRFSKEHVGLVLMHKVILRAIAENSAEFDFLRGKEGYKYRWAKHHRGSLRLTHSGSLPLRAAHDIAAMFGGLPLTTLGKNRMLRPR